MKQFDLIVIGAGISGMAVAMRAVEAGMHVAIVDDHATVGEGASFFHSGVMLPPPLDPWFGPDAALATPGGVPWRRSARERATDALRHARLAPLQPLIAQSASRLEALARRYEIDFERRDGALYVWRNATAFQRVQDLLAEWPGLPAGAKTSPEVAPPSPEVAPEKPVDTAAMTSPATAIETVAAPRVDMYGHTPRILDGEACRAMEPALEHAEALAGGIAFDGLKSGNAAVMAKRLKQCLDAADVRFFLAREAIRIDVHANGVDVSIRPAQQAVGAFSGVQARGFMAPSTAPILGLDARQTDPSQHVEKISATNVVIAAGAGSAKLLGDLGISLPLQRVTRATLTGTVLREDYAPRHLLVDAENGAAIVRFDRRVRVSSCLYGQAATIAKVSRKGAGLPPGPPAKALQALPAQLHRWRDSLVPGAARFDGPAGESVALVGADGMPVIGTLRGRDSGGRLHLVLSGAHRGWGLAFGAADLLFAQWGHAMTNDGAEGHGHAPRTADAASDVDAASNASEASHDATDRTTDAPETAQIRDARDTFDSAARLALSPARFGY